eukprot:Skav204064  [mRNA]  locus=scaffold3:453706:456303:- [translate_table: standard]
MSMSQNLLDRCLEAAAGRGTDFASEYRPLTNQEVFGSVDMEAPTTESTTDTPGGPGTMQKYAKWFSRASALVFIPFTSGFPAGVFIFMCTNMVTAALQNRVLRNPAVERWLEIPPRAGATPATGVASASVQRRLCVALTNLGLTLKQRPKNSLLGAPQSMARGSMKDAVPFARAPQLPGSLLDQKLPSGPSGALNLAELQSRSSRFAVKRPESQ